MNLQPGNARPSAARVPARYARTFVQALGIRARRMMRRVLARCMATLASLRDDNRDLRCDEAFFWVTLYNAALLEADPEQLHNRVQLALRAVGGRSRTLEHNAASIEEWNLLQYAAIVLKRLARNAQHARTRTPSLQTKEAA